MSDIEDPAIGLEAGSCVLFGEGVIDRELGCREPEFESFRVPFYVGVQDFGEDVFAHFAKERFHLKGGVHFAEFLDYLGGFIFRKEAGDSVGYAARGGN